MYKDRFKRDTTIQLSGGSYLELHDYRNATKTELVSLIHRKKGFLKGVHLDRESFLNLLELKEQGSQFSLRGANLTGINLSPLFYFDKAKKQQVAALTIVRGLDLSGAILNQADLSGVLFERCDLKGAVFRKTNLDKASFMRCEVDGAVFPRELRPRQVYSSKGRTKAFYGSTQDNQRMLAGFVALRDDAIAQQKSPSRFRMSILKRGIKNFFDSGRAAVVPHVYANILAVRKESASTREPYKSRDAEFKMQTSRSAAHAKTTSSSTTVTPAMPNTNRSKPQIPDHVKAAVRQAQRAFAHKGNKVMTHRQSLERRRESRSATVNNVRTD